MGDEADRMLDTSISLGISILTPRRPIKIVNQDKRTLQRLFGQAEHVKQTELEAERDP